MLSTEAHVQTDRSNRYLVQLCRHANQMGQHRSHRPRTHNGDDKHTPPEVEHVEWTDTDGIVRLNWGQWTVQATPGTLTLRAEAADPENLRRIQNLLAARLAKIGRRDNLTVTWQPPPDAPTGQPGHGTGTHSASAAQAVAHRKRSTTIGLIAAAALAIAVHLGLGGAALAGSRWTDLATNLVLALVALKVIAVVVIALRHRANRRSKTGTALSGSGSPHPSLHGRRSSARASTSSDKDGAGSP